MNIKTDEEVISLVTEYIANNKYATRSDLRKVTGVTQTRLQQLAAEGHFKFPAPVSRKVRHLYGKSEWANNFKLPNSPTGRRA
jgi:hypothetical protein